MTTKNETLLCGFCHTTEQGKHGEVRRVWAEEWNLYIPLCRKHDKPESPVRSPSPAVGIAASTLDMVRPAGGSLNA